MLAVDPELVETMVDVFYSFDTSTNPDLRQNGRLRPAVHAFFASQIMCVYVTDVN